MLKITVEIKENKEDPKKADVKLTPPKDYSKATEIETLTTKVLFNAIGETLKNIK